MTAINPLSVSRYRGPALAQPGQERRADALELANILRTDPHSHRPLPADSELAQSIQVLARAHQDAVWDRMQIINKLRSVLREYYPAFLAAFTDLASREARAVLRLAPSPASGQTARTAALTAALRRAGFSRLSSANCAAATRAGTFRSGATASTSTRPYARSARPASSTSWLGTSARWPA